MISFPPFWRVFVLRLVKDRIDPQLGNGITRTEELLLICFYQIGFTPTKISSKYFLLLNYKSPVP